MPHYLSLYLYAFFYHWKVVFLMRLNYKRQQIGYICLKIILRQIYRTKQTSFFVCSFANLSLQCDGLYYRSQNISLLWYAWNSSLILLCYELNTSDICFWRIWCWHVHTCSIVFKSMPLSHNSLICSCAGGFQASLLFLFVRFILFKNVKNST